MRSRSSWGLTGKIAASNHMDIAKLPILFRSGAVYLCTMKTNAKLGDWRSLYAVLTEKQCCYITIEAANA